VKAMPQTRDKIMVSGFDGTMTKHDFFSVAAPNNDLPPAGCFTS